MKYRKRIYYTEADKALMWNRWQKGDTLQEIARLFDRHHSPVRGILERTGGITTRITRHFTDYGPAVPLPISSTSRKRLPSHAS